MDDDDDGYGGQVRGEETLEIEVEKIGVTQGEDLRRTDTWRRLFLPFFYAGRDLWASALGDGLFG